MTDVTRNEKPSAVIHIQFSFLSAANVIAANDQYRPYISGVWILPSEDEKKTYAKLRSTNGHLMWIQQIRLSKESYIEKPLFIPKEKIILAEKAKRKKHDIVGVLAYDDRVIITGDSSQEIPDFSWENLNYELPQFDKVESNAEEALKEEFQRAGLTIDMNLMELVVRAAKKLPISKDKRRALNWIIPPNVSSPSFLAFDEVTILCMPILDSYDVESYNKNKEKYDSKSK